MPTRRAFLASLAVLLAPTGTATAQRPTVQLDSARGQIRTTLQAFYFNLAHLDWEALTADILPAKVVAHRRFPEARVKAGSSAADGRVCGSPGTTALVDQAIITLDGDWAEVSVPRCSAGPAGADRFRLIHFEERWRLVYINLFQQPANVSTDR
jgi:hypothetical protein